MFWDLNLKYLVRIQFNIRRYYGMDVNNHPVIYVVKKFKLRILVILLVIAWQ